jgi:predicted nuclease of restriction endonuclease-like RecB superfamily
MASKRTKRETKKRASRPTSKNGYRSGLEDRAANQLKECGLPVMYERDILSFLVPSRRSTYTPDFKLPKRGGFFYVETKGIWSVQERQRYLLVRDQLGIDLRMVFSNANAKLYKGSPTTYAAFCDKHGIPWAHKVIPEDWIRESKDAISSSGPVGPRE